MDNHTALISTPSHGEINFDKSTVSSTPADDLKEKFIILSQQNPANKIYAFKTEEGLNKHTSNEKLDYVVLKVPNLAKYIVFDDIDFDKSGALVKAYVTNVKSLLQIVKSLKAETITPCKNGYCITMEPILRLFTDLNNAYTYSKTINSLGLFYCRIVEILDIE
jgi:hypothetical protein